MKLCVPIPCFFPCSTTEQFIAAIHKSAELGYTAVETYDWRMLDTSAVKSTLEDTGVELCSILVMENRLTTPDCRDLWLTSLRETCEAAVKMGVKRAITQVGNDTGAPREVQHTAIVETLKAAKPILEQYGVTVMPEPLNVKVNHPGYYLTTASEAFDIIREVDSPFVKVVYDIYHQQVTEGDIIPTVTKNLDLIAHLLYLLRQITLDEFNCQLIVFCIFQQFFIQIHRYNVFKVMRLTCLHTRSACPLLCACLPLRRP